MTAIILVKDILFLAIQLLAIKYFNNSLAITIPKTNNKLCFLP